MFRLQMDQLSKHQDMLHIFSNSSNLAERVFLMRAIQSASAPLHFPAGQPNTFLCGYSIQIIILTSFHQNWAKVIFFNRTSNTHQRKFLDTWCCLLMHAGNFFVFASFLMLDSVFSQDQVNSLSNSPALTCSSTALISSRTSLLPSS